MACNETVKIRSRCGSPSGFRLPSRPRGGGRVDRVWHAKVRSRPRKIRVVISFFGERQPGASSRRTTNTELE